LSLTVLHKYILSNTMENIVCSMYVHVRRCKENLSVQVEGFLHVLLVQCCSWLCEGSVTCENIMYLC